MNAAGCVASRPRADHCVTRPVTHGPEFAGFRTLHANIGLISTRRDGRVIDGGGLGKQIAPVVEVAIFRLNSVRRPR